MSRTHRTLCDGDYLIDRDFFGHPVSLQYLGREKYKTKLGGFCSLIVFAMILTMMIEIIVQLTIGDSYKVFNSKVYFNTTEQLGDNATFKDLQLDLSVGTYDLNEHTYV